MLFSSMCYNLFLIDEYIHNFKKMCIRIFKNKRLIYRNIIIFLKNIPILIGKIIRKLKIKGTILKKLAK